MLQILSGVYGSATVAPGWTSLIHRWALQLSADVQDMTPLSPAGGHQQLLHDGLLRGAAGNYSCRLPVGIAALTSASALLNSYADEWTFVSNCEARDSTPLGSAWKRYIPGLITSGCELVHYLDALHQLPLMPQSGGIDTLTLQVDAGHRYGMHVVQVGSDTAVNVEDAGGERKITSRFASTAEPTSYGAMPLAGVVITAATFVAEGGVKYRIVTPASALITSVMVKVNRRTSTGSIDIGFVLDGALIN